jgi:ABC-type antimicrobial peptide transport system permease subunit
MSYIITFLAALIIGFIGGALFFRNNADKIKTKEDSGKKLLDALKGR